MASNKWQLFLEQNSFKNEIINSSTFLKCDVDTRENRWQLTVRFTNVVPLKDLLRFYEQASIYFKPPQVTKTRCTIKYTSISEFINYYKEYYNHFLLFFNRQRCGLLDNYEIDYDSTSNTIFIITEDDNNYIKQFLKEMEKTFEDHFFRVNFALRFDETKTRLEDKIKHEQKIETETNSKRIELYEEQKIIEKKRNVSFSSSHRFDSVQIIEIPTSSEGLYEYKNNIGDTKFNIAGEIDRVEIRELKNNLKLLSFDIVDETSAITCKKFVSTPKDVAEAKSLKSGDYVELSGMADYDSYARDVIIKIYSYQIVAKPIKKLRQDNASEKRVEFHIHSKMSNLDGLATPEEIISQAEAFGHEGFAITDYNALYAYPDIAKAIKGKSIKPVYGVEFGLADDKNFVTAQTQNDFLLSEATYVVFDLESTGLSINYDEIIEIGAVKIRNGAIVEKFDHLVKPKQIISKKITDITNISNDMVLDKPSIEVVLPEFLKFISGTVVVAHNAVFDLRMLNEKAKSLGLKAKYIGSIDTLPVARYFLKDKLKKFGLDTLCKYYQVELNNHHRAMVDAEATANVFLKMLADINYAFKIKTICELRDTPKKDSNLYQYIVKPYRFDMLCKNQQGYKDLFKLISLGLTEYFYKVPRLTPALVEKYRTNLLVGSGSDEGVVYETALFGTDQELDEVVKFYDYICVLPPCALVHLQDMFDDKRFSEVIADATRRIIDISKKNKKIVIATGNVHYLNRSEKEYYKILTTAKRVGGGLHRLQKYDVLPDYSFLTTSEMLNEFSFLPKELAYEIVVTNTRKLLSLIEDIKPFPDELYSLSDDCFAKSLGVASTKDEVRKIVSANLTKQYGSSPHPIIKERVEFELKTIIKNNYAPIYYIAHLLVKDSTNNGYVVGSRGSVGSSLVATLLEVTEVNPLAPHYYCPDCGYQFFKVIDPQAKENLTVIETKLQRNFDGITSGFDLPEAKCPHCGKTLHSDGHDIPFATFLGFAGDKVPDIDLNFSGEYQKRAHDYVRNLLGVDYTFRAGTIQKAAEKTSYGYVKAYLDAEGKEMRKPHINYIAKKIEGVLRTTSQHPGGIVVVPENHTIFDVTPVQYPSDNVEFDWKTSHFDYHSFESNLLKLDILGHDYPTTMKFIMDYVKAHPDEFPFSEVQDIPLNDPKVYEMFGDTSCLGISSERIFAKIATYGLPEFGTTFVRGMLEEIKPQSFGDLVKVSGLSHGESIWMGNSQDLISPTNPNRVKFSDIIGCRDDIMINLINNYQVAAVDAFKIMEFIRKGKQHSSYDQWLQISKQMLAAKVPKWYVDSAYKIKYLFPKAHACAYVIMALRIAWFKYYKPLLFYASFFSKRVDQFEPIIMTSGNNAIYNRLRELKTADKLTDIEKKLVTTLEMAIEMSERGYKFLPIDIEKSDSTDFLIEKDGLRLPFVACSGLGKACADSIVEQRNVKPFKSKDDVRDRTKVNKTIFQVLDEMGSFGELTDTHVKNKTLFDLN